MIAWPWLFAAFVLGEVVGVFLIALLNDGDDDES